jgi:hypothetical protein
VINFSFLRDHPEWLNKCYQTMVTLCKKPPDSLEEPEHKTPFDAQGTPNNVKGGLPHDRNQISRETTGDIVHPEEIA